MGKLDARVFQGLQTELDKLSWSAGHMRTQSSPARTTLETTELVATCDVDHVARRITLLSIVTRAHKALRDSVPNESEGA